MKHNSYRIAVVLLVLILTFTCTCLSACSTSHDVTFRVDGADFATIETAGKESITLPTSPTKEGYAFAGWFEDDGVWDKPFTADSLRDTKLKKDMTVYARWNAVNVESATYAISFVGGEGATGTAPTAQSLAASTQYILPDNTFAKEGYTFAGWSDGTTTYASAATYTVAASNVVFTATWRIIRINVTFDVDGGEAIAPMELDYGSTLSVALTPTAVKENVRFGGWYLDEALTQPLAYDGYRFTADTVLYASFAEPATLADSNFYGQEEALLASQPDNVAFVVLSDTPLNNENLATYVSVTSAANTVPTLAVTNGEEEGQYVISPTGSYQAGGEYNIVVANGMLVNALIREDTVSVSSITFRIAAPERNTIEMNDDIINIGIGDFYSYTDSYIGLKQQFVFDNAVAKGRILCVTDNSGNQEHYKAGEMTLKRVGTQDYYEVQLLPCELYEIYDNVDITCDGSATFSDEELEFLATEEMVESMLMNNSDYRLYQGLVASAITDYAVSLGEDSAASVEDKEITFSFSKGKEGSATYAKIELTASFKVEFSETTYAVVTIEATEKVIVDFTGHIKVFADVFETEGGSTYDIDFLTILRSETGFNMNVILTNNGKTIDIKKDLEKLVRNYDQDSFVKMYKDNLGLDGGELTIIDFQVCRLAIPVKIVEVGIPISFRTKLDVNAPFSCDMTVIVEKGYLMKGTQKTGLTRKSSDRVTYYGLDFGSVGYIGVKAGIAVGIELSFNKLSCVGVIGLEVEVGAYFDYYGYGSQEISGLYIFGKGKPKNSGQAVYYYEFGIYLDINAYVKSELFSFKKSAGLYSAKFPLFDGGTRYVILGFAESDEEKHIVTSSPTLDLTQSGLLDMSVIDLTTGELSVVIADLDNIDAWTSGSVLFDDSDGTISVNNHFVEHELRTDGTINISFNGKHADFANYWLYSTVKYTYIPPHLNIPPEDVNKICTVTFQVDGVTITTQKILIGKYMSNMKGILAEAKKYDSNIANLYWGERTSQPVLEDIVMTPQSVYYKEGQITLNYMKSGSNSVGNISRTIRADAGTNVSDIIGQLEDFEQTVGGAYKFVGWDGDVNAILPPLSYYEGGVDLVYTASYEAIPFEYTIVLSPLYDADDNVIEEKRVVTRTYTYGDMVDLGSDKELRRIGYELTLVGDNEKDCNASHMATAAMVIQGTYILRDDYTVTVYTDSSQTTILYQQSNVAYGMDLSGILDGSAPGTEDVLQYVNETDGSIIETEQGMRLKRVFLGWAGANLLNNITMDVAVYGMSELEFLGAFTYTIRFDALGGKFPQNVEYRAVNGITLVPNDTIDADELLSYEPTYLSTDPLDEGYVYEFVGWYDNADLTGEAYPTITADADKVLYAKYERQAQACTVRMLSSGYWQRVEKDENDNYVTASDAVGGLFDDEQTQYELNNVTLATANSLIEDIRSGNVDTDTYPNFAKTPIATDSAFTFSHWQVNAFDTYQELVPIYKKADTVITINYHYVQGVTFQNRIYSVVIELAAEDSLPLAIDKLYTPAFTNDSMIYNNTTGEWEQIHYCFEDGQYYYVPQTPICWATTKHGMPITEADYPNYTLELNGDDEIRSYDFYAVYQVVPKTRVMEFIIDTSSTALESWQDPELNSWSYSIKGGYGDELTADMIPTALKAIPNNEVPYQYEFSHWVRMYFDPDYPESYDELIMSEITCTTQELLSPEYAFNEDTVWKAVFAKNTRYVTITFDAGENGYFKSNDSQYRTMTVPACVDVDFGETPVYRVPQSGYYNYTFDNWSYVEPFAFSDNGTVTAQARQVRNDTPAPDTGVTVSWLNYSGDIASAHGDIPGYFYYPDEGRIEVYGTGLTFTGTAEDICFYIGSGDVTLSDLTISVNDQYAIYLYAAYYNNMSGQNRVDEIPIGINIVGTVELNGNYPTLIGTSGNYEIHLTGIGEDAKLLVNHNSQEIENASIRLMELDDYLLIDNLDMEVNATIHESSSFQAFPLQHIYLTMTNSNIVVDVEGSVINADNEYDNAYAFYIDPIFSDSVFLPEDLADNIVVTGCEKLFVDEPEDDSSIPFPTWQQD